MFKYLLLMQINLKRILIFGFSQLLILIILSNYIVDGTVNIMGNNGFKVGSKTFMIEEVEGLEFSTDQHYNEVFSQPYATFFILKDIGNNQVEMVLSGTQIRTNDYQNFDDIISDYKKDSTITVFSAEQINDYLFIKFRSSKDSSRIYYSRFYQAYPYFLQLFGVSDEDSGDMPDEMKKALNAVRIVE